MISQKYKRGWFPVVNTTMWNTRTVFFVWFIFPLLLLLLYTTQPEISIRGAVSVKSVKVWSNNFQKKTFAFETRMSSYFSFSIYTWHTLACHSYFHQTPTLNLFMAWCAFSPEKKSFPEQESTHTHVKTITSEMTTAAGLGLSLKKFRMPHNKTFYIRTAFTGIGSKQEKLHYIQLGAEIIYNDSICKGHENGRRSSWIWTLTCVGVEINKQQKLFFMHSHQ